MKVYAVEIKADVPYGWHLAWFEAMSFKEQITKDKIIKLGTENESFQYLIDNDRVRIIPYELNPIEGEHK